LNSRTARLFGILVFFCFSTALQAGQVSSADSGYLSELVQRARTLQLAESRAWLGLLHYQPHLILPGRRSLVDDPRFFLAPAGKTDPEAELEATLASFFPAVMGTNDPPPACRFTARYRWLKEQLHFDPTRLPEPSCPRYQAWRAALKPHQVTLVFATAFLNNPASMYGHTLLRLDANDQDERTRLLALTVNYAAATTERGGLMYALKGLFGGYAGRFSLAPYFHKVREYNDIENRDIWEYPLNFTPAEIERLLAHLWELGPTYFDYYFFDENCSYHLLSLLEAARPDLRLTEHFRGWAIPSDTVRAVVTQRGLLKQAIYRPGKASVVRDRAARLAPGERQLARAITDAPSAVTVDGLSVLPVERQTAVLELAHEYLSYRRLTGRTDASVTAQETELLQQRNRLPVAAQPYEVPAPAVRPDEAHGTARVGVAAGVREGRRFEELRWRASYHDLLDDERGYTHGAQLQFFDIAARRYQDREIRLEEFRPLDIVSLAPRDEFFDSISWKLNAGWTRRRLADGAEPLVLRVNGAPGLSWEAGVAYRTALVYGFLDITLESDNRLHQGYALGAGPAVGWLLDVSPRWRAQLLAGAQHFSFGENFSARTLALNQRLSLGRDSALRLDLRHERVTDQVFGEVKIAWQVYF
jgi:hypothetical protein